MSSNPLIFKLSQKEFNYFARALAEGRMDDNDNPTFLNFCQVAYKDDFLYFLNEFIRLTSEDNFSEEFSRKDKDGNSALMFSVLNRVDEDVFREVLTIYIDFEIDPFETNFKGESILHWLIKRERFHDLIYMIEQFPKKLDFLYKDDFGKSPVDYLREFKGTYPEDLEEFYKNILTEVESYIYRNKFRKTKARKRKIVL